MQKSKEVKVERKPDCRYQIGDREFWLYRFNEAKPSALAFELRQGIGKWRKQG
jgi:hypothetical protein